MDLVLSLLMLCALALLAGAAFLWRRGDARKQALLMAVLAAVMLVNVAIWLVPDKSGAAPKDRAASAPS